MTIMSWRHATGDSESQPTTPAPAESKRTQQAPSASLIDRRRRVSCAGTDEMSSLNGLRASIGLTRRRLDQRLFGPPRVVGLLQIGFGRARIPGLRHGKPKQQQTCSGDAGQGQEGGAVSQADDHKATTVVDNAAPTPCA